MLQWHFEVSFLGVWGSQNRCHFVHWSVSGLQLPKTSRNKSIFYNNSFQPVNSWKERTGWAHKRRLPHYYYCICSKSIGYPSCLSHPFLAKCFLQSKQNRAHLARFSRQWNNRTSRMRFFGKKGKIYSLLQNAAWYIKALKQLIKGEIYAEKERQSYYLTVGCQTYKINEMRM